MNAYIPIFLDSVLGRKDGSIKLVFDSQKAEGKEYVEFLSELCKLTGAFGNLLFTTSNEVEPPPAPKRSIDGGLTPAESLRRVLFKLWKSRQPKDDKQALISFEDFYKTSIMKVVETVVKKIEKEQLTNKF